MTFFPRNVQVKLVQISRLHYIKKMWMEHSYEIHFQWNSQMGLDKTTSIPDDILGEGGTVISYTV